MIKNLLAGASVLLFGLGSAQENFWKPVSILPQKRAVSERRVMPAAYKLYSLDLRKMNTSLAKAPDRFSSAESLVLKFPDENGNLSDYIVKESSVMDPGLQEKFPEIRSYVGYQKKDRTKTIRFSTSPYEGISILYFNGKKRSYLDAYTKDKSVFMVYNRASLPDDPSVFNCGFRGEGEMAKNDIAEKASPLTDVLVSDGFIRTYRLALACTIEYAAYHIKEAGVQGGSMAEKKAAVLAAMNTTMTRVNGIYETNLAVSMKLIPNNDQIIFIDSDQYDNENSDENDYPLLDQNQKVLDATIGTANYDIGHVLSTASGGVAMLAATCDKNTKAMGTTGTTAPVNDAFDVDYVAHEMGHQFGADHTFRATTGNCGGGNISKATAIEVGSGTTIMAYAGICGVNNVQKNSDPYFHSVSVAQIFNTIYAGNGSKCPVKTNANNARPVADAGADYTIPYGTAFVLTGSATDADDNELTYLWEQIDNQYATQPPKASATAGPVFRSYPPSESPSRYIPAMSYVVNNNLAPKWEMIPQKVSRKLNFSLLVSDQRITGAQSSRDLMLVNVVNTGPFKVTSQNSEGTEFSGGDQITVTWDVAGTDANAINVSDVKILLSDDNGYHYPYVLSESVPNNGSAVVTIPNETIDAARIMVKANGNIFFALNKNQFKITKKSLSVNDLASKKAFVIYPNPAKGEVNVQLNSKAGGSYTIYDLSGKLVQKGILKTSSEKIGIAGLPAGVYRLTVFSDGTGSSQSLIIR